MLQVAIDITNLSDAVIKAVIFEEAVIHLQIQDVFPRSDGVACSQFKFCWGRGKKFISTLYATEAVVPPQYRRVERAIPGRGLLFHSYRCA